jgi:hypothetical protein
MSSQRSKQVLSLAWVSATASADGASIELEENGAEYIVSVVNSATTGGDETATFTLEHSPDDTNWFNVPSVTLTAIDSSAFLNESEPVAATLYKYVRASYVIGAGATGGATTTINIHYKLTE